MDVKRRKGLRFHCEDKWHLGHVCKKPKAYFIQHEVDIEDQSDVEVDTLSLKEPTHLSKEEDL